MSEASCLIDGFGPVPVRRPASAAELGDMVRQAAHDGQAVYPLGGRTMLDFGQPPKKPGSAVDLAELDQVVDYPARDMTITVQAGIRVARLQAILAPENQRLPIDVPWAEQATLGGILACNVSGPRRLGYGTLRDYVLGISAVNDEGQEIKAGGRVVKNVAGYDLCKLLVGSLGTLGIITQATLKLRPLTEEQVLIGLFCEAGQVAELLDLIHGSRTRPVCLDLFNRPAVRLVHEKSGVSLRDSSWMLVAGYEGNPDAIKWQVQQLILELGGRVALEAWLGPMARPLWQALVDLPVPAFFAADEGLAFKANLRPGGTAEFCLKANDAGDVSLQAHAGNGIVRGHVGGLALERAQVVLKELRARAREFDGTVVVCRCPSPWKETISIWGDPRADTWLMRRVKETLDPRGLFNPGRFVDGI